MDLLREIECELDCLPLFPLPTTVLFPGIVLPLQVTEPRYNAMVADVLAGDAHVAVAMPKAPAGAGDDHPDVHEIAAAARIIHHEQLEGGCYNVLLQGVHRVRLLEELPREHDYRRFRVAVIPQPTLEDTEAAKHELAKLESVIMSLVSAVADSDAQLVEVIRSTTDPIKLADILAATVVADVLRQQELLAAADLRTRLSKLIDCLADVLVRVGRPATASVLN